MTIYGAQLIVDNGFNDPAKWTVTAAGGASGSVSGGKAHLVTPGADSIQVRPNPLSPAAEVGQAYRLEAHYEILAGAWQLNYGGVLHTNLVDSGIYVFDIEATSTPAYLDIHNYGSGPGELYVDWVSLRRIGVAGAFSINMVDRDDDSRQFTLPVTEVTAANHDAQKALAGALVTAIEGISKLVTQRWDFIADRTEPGDPRPTAGSAQVNIEWQVTYVEATTLEVRTVRIGGANLDLSGVLLDSSNIADLSQTEMAAFVSAFEAYVLGPNGNAVTVQQVAFLE